MPIEQKHFTYQVGHEAEESAREGSGRLRRSMLRTDDGKIASRKKRRTCREREKIDAVRGHHRDKSPASEHECTGL